MVEVSQNSIKRVWKILRIIHNKENSITDLNNIRDWIYNLYGLRPGKDRWVPEADPKISDDEFMWYEQQISIASEAIYQRYKKQGSRNNVC